MVNTQPLDGRMGPHTRIFGEYSKDTDNRMAQMPISDPVYHLYKIVIELSSYL